jgi:nicotinate-nucleotide pyrophosphorylase (carboxylating)
MMELSPPLTEEDVARVIDAALIEDLGRPDAAADITSMAVIPQGVRFEGVMRAREPLVVAGLPVAARVFRRLAEDAGFLPCVEEGATVAAGDVIARLSGPARALLAAERVALNFLQHLSGIATETRRYVEAIADTGCVLLDTRKTTPGLRRLEKYATRMGGARNHRMGLHDAILIKDNHLAVCGSVAEAVARARAAGHAQIEVECDTLDQVREAVEAGATRVLLDNMDLATLRRAVAIVGGRAETEASGGVRLETVRAIAETGVDYVSVGRITQSAPAVDIGLDWQPA